MAVAGVEDLVIDRVGLAWRPELAADIHLHLEHIDVLEIIADNHFCAERNERAVLRSIARERPTTLHGVGMGLASASPVERKRVDAMARLVEVVQPSGWSEHLAFVRAGGIEIGHLAAPPRTRATIDGALANIGLATRIVGIAPALENIATLIDPPTSTHDEPSWTRSIVQGARTSLLLDLHNLYANALNFGRDPLDLLAAMPLESVRTVHLSGGKWIIAPSGGERLLDDHLHAPPRAVYALLTELAARVSHPLEVIIERDGEYPPIQELLDQIRLARAALSIGRLRRPSVNLGIAA
jgi:uncharacterized protein